jgi:hypothetical protein
MSIGEEYYHDWKSDHLSGLEESFLAKVTPPVLDDDIPDYLDDNTDDFEEHCRERFNEEVDL